MGAIPALTFYIGVRYEEIQALTKENELLSGLSGTKAVTSTVDDDCGVTQGELNECAVRHAAKEEEIMLATLEKAKEVAKKNDKDGYDPSAEYRRFKTTYIKVLLDSQQAWSNYREKQCAAEGRNWEGGSAQPMIIAGCMGRSAKQRTEDLKSISFL